MTNWPRAPTAIPLPRTLWERMGGTWARHTQPSPNRRGEYLILPRWMTLAHWRQFIQLRGGRDVWSMMWWPGVGFPPAGARLRREREQNRSRPIYDGDQLCARCGQPWSAHGEDEHGFVPAASNGAAVLASRRSRRRRSGRPSAPRQHWRFFLEDA